jgi:hypothetical protein
MEVEKAVKPVTFPPGRAKLSTKPDPTGSATLQNTQRHIRNGEGVREARHVDNRLPVAVIALRHEGAAAEGLKVRDGGQADFPAVGIIPRCLTALLVCGHEREFPLMA